MNVVSMEKTIEIVGVCRRTLQRMIHANRIQVFMIRGKYFFPATEVTRLRTEKEKGRVQTLEVK